MRDALQKTEHSKQVVMCQVCSENNQSLPNLLCSMRVTNNDNGITNAIEIFHTREGGTRIMTANNDQMVRVYDAAHFQVVR